MKIEHRIPLKNFTTLHIGGVADFFARVRTIKDAQKVFVFAREKKLPLFFFGGGSNVLFSDAGFRGVVMRNEIKGIKLRKNCVTVGSGVALAGLVQKTATKKLAGLENLAGIPGTVGGAIAGNAGAHGTEIGALVRSATILTYAGKIKNVDQKYFRFRYRDSALKKSEDFLLDMTLALTPTRENLESKIQTLLRERLGKQPRGLSAGSFFRNPKGRKAWELVEKAGLRGTTIGGASISDTHTNWLVNHGNATAKDFHALAKLIQKKVFEKSGVRLKPEVMLVRAKMKNKR